MPNCDSANCFEIKISNCERSVRDEVALREVGRKEKTYLHTNDQQSNEQSQGLGEERYSHTAQNTCVAISICSLSL
jgi:hypothetical protein